MVELVAERCRSQLRTRMRGADRPCVCTLVAVTKGHPPEVAAAALAAGCVDLGESYAQELVPKAAGARRRRRRAALALHRAAAVQQGALAGRHRRRCGTRSTAPSLAVEIAKRSPGASVLVQLDLAGLPGRGGCDPAEAPALVHRCTELGLDVRGLMGVGAPGTAGGRRGRASDCWTTSRPSSGLEERSMGMSGDLEVAVEEGATLVRVGTALVGPRS